MIVAVEFAVVAANSCSGANIYQDLLPSDMIGPNNVVVLLWPSVRCDWSLVPHNEVAEILSEILTNHSASFSH